MRSLVSLLLLTTVAVAGEWPRTLDCYRGSTPRIDGYLTGDEWADATRFEGVADWTPQFSPTTEPADLSLVGWVKHDGRDLYFAFRVTDDVLYGLDTCRWLPEKNPRAHELSRAGWPWFGDEMELLLNAAYRWSAEDNQNCAGDGSSWQMVCNLTKSRNGGVGVGGLLEGEPRAKAAAWTTYQRWILTGAQQAVARLERSPAISLRQAGRPARAGARHRRGGSYVIEWRVRANPCLEVRPGEFWSPALGTVKMGLNIALGDLDEKWRGAGNFGNFHHEDWWAGERGKRTWLKQWGTLIVHPDERPRPAEG